MSLRALASMLVKFLGLYTVVQSLNALALVWVPLSNVLHDRIMDTFVGRFPTWGDVLPGLGVGVAQISIGIGLWWFSDGIASTMVKEDDSHAPLPEGHWREAGLGVMGVYLLADSASRFVLFSTLWLNDDGPKEMRPLMVAALVRCAIGLWLVLGARGIVRGVVNLKNVGRDPEMEKAK